MTFVNLSRLAVQRLYNKYLTVFQPDWGKGQGAIYHANDKRSSTVQSATNKIWAQSSTQMKRDIGKILWAVDENMGTNLQAFYSSSAVGKHKNSNTCTIRAWRYINREGHMGMRAGRKILREGRRTLKNMPSWNLEVWNTAVLLRSFISLSVYLVGHVAGVFL